MARPPLPVNMIALLVMLGGCAWLPPAPDRPRDVFTVPVTNRGHLVTSEMLSQLTPGVSTRNDVQAALGTPSHAGTFSDESWYYISSQTRLRPARSLAVRDQRVVVVEFDPRGTLREVRQMGEADMRSVDIVARETPTPGNERTLLQALFGNIGRVGPNPAGTGLGQGVGQSAPGAPGLGAGR